jgi:hypothetical protein
MVFVSLESGSDRVRPLDYFCIQDKMQYGISSCWPFGRQGRNEPNILAGLRKIPESQGLQIAFKSEYKTERNIEMC